MASLTALSRITLGRAGVPTGLATVTSGTQPLGVAQPQLPPNLGGELGVCTLTQDAGSLLSLTKKGVWQNLEGNSISTRGAIPTQFQLANPDCRPGILQTLHGPLTKGLGDAQLAGPQDVEVLVNGAPRSVLYVEPTLGIIVLAQSIQPGAQVQVSYSWTPAPCLEFKEFNNFGFTFNRLSSSAQGPFQYDLLLGPGSRTPQPLEIGHTYTAWDAPYTATFGDPTSLRFNEPPASLTATELSRSTGPSGISFEGGANPPVEDGWDFSGTGSSSPSFEDGLFIVDDAASQTSLWTAPLDLTMQGPWEATLNVRVRLFDWTLAQGVTGEDPEVSALGVTAGFSGPAETVKLGFLQSSTGSIFAGILGTQGDESQWESYLGHQAELEPRGSGGVFVTDQIRFKSPVGFGIGTQLFIEGSIFSVQAIAPDPLNPAWTLFLLDSEIVGHVQGDLLEVFGVIPDPLSLTAYRVYRSSNQEITVTSGAFGNLPIIRTTSTSLPEPEEVYGLLKENQVFFGADSAQTASKSGWDFIRLSVRPADPEDRASVVEILSDFTGDLQLASQGGWSFIEDQGQPFVLTGGTPTELVLEHESPYGGLFYAQTEPLLTTKADAELLTRVRVDQMLPGSTAAEIRLVDDHAAVLLQFTAGSVLTRDYLASFSGFDPDPENEAWVAVSLPAAGGYQTWVRDHHVHFSNLGSEPFEYRRDIVEFVPNGALYDTYVAASATLKFDSWTPNYQGRANFVMGTDDGVAEVFVSFLERPGFEGIVFTLRDGTVLADSFGDPLGFSSVWTDGAFHTWKVVRSGPVISAWQDGKFLGTVGITDLGASTSATPAILFKSLGDPLEVSIEALFGYSQDLDTRRIGLNGEFVDYDFFGTSVDVRVSRTPWGSTQVFLDDVLYFDKQYSELSPRLDSPQLNTPLGYVQFGTPDGFSKSVWEYFNVRISNGRAQQLTLPRSVFNAALPTTSAEVVKDTDVEVHVFERVLSRVHFPSSGFLVRKVLSVVHTTTGAALAYTLTESGQVLTLDTPLSDGGEDITVSFLGKPPYSKAWIAKQDPWITLHKGTPAFELGHDAVLQITQTVLNQSNALDPVTQGQATYEDGVLRITFESVSAAANAGPPFYKSLDPVSTDLRGSREVALSPACDLLGFSSLTLDGYQDVYQHPPEPPDGLGARELPFILDQVTSTLDGLGAILDPLTSPEATVALLDFRVDTVPPASDSLPSGFLVQLGGFVLDGLGALDDPAIQLDTYTETVVPLTFV